MKLAIVTAFPPSKVTLNEYAYHLVKHFRQFEEVSEIVLLTDVTPTEADLNFKEAGCRVSVVSCWQFNSYFNVLSITKTLRAIKPDAVLYNIQFMKFGDRKIPAALGLFAPYFTKLLGMKTIVLLHNIVEAVDLDKAGITSNALSGKLFSWVGNFLTRVLLKADIVALTIGNYVKIIKEKYHATNCMLIPHGSFELAEEPSFEMPAGPLKIMTFGKFGSYKKVEVLIEAVELARRITGKDLEVVIAGTDNPNTLGYLAGVRAKYAHLPGIHFTGYVAEEDVPRVFSESAMVVFPYTSTTGSSGVLHQAGSYGKAVVMPNLGDLALLVEEEGYRGEFFEPQNASSLAEAIARLVVNTTYRIELAKANFEAANALPMSVIAQRYLDAFKSLDTQSEDELLSAA